jgi:hypothetical protein
VLRCNDIHAWHARFVSALQVCARPALVEPPRLQANVR